MQEKREEHEELLRGLIDVFWNQMATDQYLEFFIPGTVIHSGIAHYTIEESISDGYANSLFRAFPDMQHEIEHLLIDGDLASMRYHGAGTWMQPYRGVEPTGQRIDYHGNVIFKLANRRIAEVRSPNGL